MRRTALVTFLTAAVIGAVIWAISPWATGSKEPWDAESVFYVAALLAGGLLSGLLSPTPLWAHYVGAVAGQLAYELVFIELDPLMLVGAVFLLAYSTVFFGGAALGLMARSRMSSRPVPGE